jgi:hypothetical protein
MTSATVFAIKISCAGWVVEKLSSGLSNALFVPKPMAAQFPAKPGLCRHLAVLPAVGRAEKRKNT